MTSIPPIAILAGGLATRLGELTQTVPKSMLDIHSEPFIAYQLRQLRRLGAQDIVLCVGHLSRSIENFVGDGSAFGLSVVYSYDGAKQQGTGGALYGALDLLDDEFIVTYGDSFLDFDLNELTQFHRQSNLPATMVIYKNDGKWDQSNVRVTSPNTIVYEQNPNETSEFIDYGASIMSRSRFAELAPTGPWDLPKLFEMLSESSELGGFRANKRFFEIGSSMGLTEFRNHIRERRFY